MKSIDKAIELIRVELKLTKTTEPDGLTGVYYRVEQLEELVKNLNLHVVSNNEVEVCCENCLHFFPDTKTCDKTCIEYDKFKQKTDC